MEKRTWTVTLGLGGEVVGAGEGVPPGWAGAVLHEHAGVPAALRDAAGAVVLAARKAGALERARVEVPELGAAVEIVALPALGLHLAATDVRALLPASVAALDRQARALDVGLSVTIHPDVPEMVTLDPEKIAWAVSALAGNSMRYVRRGTRHMPGGSIAVNATRGAGGELVLVVEDDGPGIPAEVLERMFHRPPGAPIATGLALTVARDIVAAHGGSLELASSTDDADHGTTATLRLPIPDDRPS
jgi:signal transduction histidine kinase